VASRWPASGAPTSRAFRPEENPTIIVARNNFHGRTTTIISFSDDRHRTPRFGPYTPGFRAVPFGDADALAAAIDENTVAVLLEPNPGEAGIIVPPDDLPAPRARVVHGAQRADDRRRNPGRPCPHGKDLRVRPLGVVPDMYLLGKALGGGIVPLSAVVADRDVLGVCIPVSTAPTFGGNPLAAAIGTTVVAMHRAG